MKKTYILEGLDCANCAAKIEKEINKLEDIKEATVNFMTLKLIIEADNEKMEDILLSCQKIIKSLEPGVMIKEA